MRSRGVIGMPKNRYLLELSQSLRELLGAREALSLRSVRRQCLPYFFAFPLAMIFVNVENFFISPDSAARGLPVTTYAFLAFTAGAIAFFAFCREDNAARVS